MPLVYVVLRLACVLLWVHVFVEYMAIDPKKKEESLIPSGIEGICPSWLLGADGGVCRLLYAVHQTFSLGPCTATGPLSSRPQSLGGVGDGTLCEDTREDFGLSVSFPSTTYCCRVVFDLCRWDPLA